MLTLLNKPTQSNNLLLVTIVEGLNILLLIVEPRKMTKIENEEETDNPTITTIANETHIETDPGAEIIIIEIEVVQEIEIIEMTEMTTALEVVIDPLTLHGDPLIVPPHLIIEMLIILMELLLPLPVPLLTKL